MTADRVRVHTVCLWVHRTVQMIFTPISSSKRGNLPNDSVREDCQTEE